MATQRQEMSAVSEFDFGKWLSGLIGKLPAREKVAARLNSLDTTLTPFYGVLMAYFMYVIGINFLRFGPSDPVSLEYFTNLFSGLSLVSFAIVAVAFFESMRRNELGDMAKVVTAIAINYVAMRYNGTWQMMILAYGLGFSLAHSASRHGKLDWTPLVAYNAVFVGMATQVFGFGAASVVWPVLIGSVFQALEIFRNEDYRAVRLAVPGMAVCVAGLVFTMNPTWWIVGGALVSFVVAPTLCKLNEGKHAKLADTIKNSSAPFSDFENGLKSIRVNAEAAMLTLTTSCLFILVMVMFS